MGKGGGGGGDGGAAAREAARKGRVDSSIRAINELFFGRKNAQVDVPVGIPFARELRDSGGGNIGGDEGGPQYYQRPGFSNQADISAANANNSALGTNLTPERIAALDNVQSTIENKFLPELEEDTSDAKRELKFALARRGLLGGSAQSDASGRLRERVSDTERDIGSRALVARNSAEASQQRLLDNLTAQAQADTDQSILLNQATSGQNAAVNSAVDTANAQQLPNVFQDVGSLFKQIVDKNNLNTGLRQGLNPNSQNSTTTSLFGGAGSPASGSIT